MRPNASTVMKRTILLKYILVKALATPPADQLAKWMSRWTDEEAQHFAMDLQRQCASEIEHLRANGIWDESIEGERKFLQANITEVTEHMRVGASWLAESIVCLLWALGSIAELPSYDEEANHNLFRTLPQGDDVNVLLSKARLRPRHVIEKQRQLSELWHWRCRTRQLIDSGQMPRVLENGTVIDDVISSVVFKAAEQGDLIAPISGDFPAFGKPFRDLSLREFATMTSIAQERHRALNWLCGFSPGNQWAETPTDT